MVKNKTWWSNCFHLPFLSWMSCKWFPDLFYIFFILYFLFWCSNWFFLPFDNVFEPTYPEYPLVSWNNIKLPHPPIQFSIHLSTHLSQFLFICPSITDMSQRTLQSEQHTAPSVRRSSIQIRKHYKTLTINKEWKTPLRRKVLQYAGN